jgi:hypothetical protein
MANKVDLKKRKRSDNSPANKSKEVKKVKKVVEEEPQDDNVSDDQSEPEVAQDSTSDAKNEESGYNPGK